MLTLAVGITQPISAYVDKPEPKHLKKAVRKETVVYTTKTGSKYHRAYCSYLRYSSFAEKQI
jgi:hypothetical protein